MGFNTPPKKDEPVRDIEKAHRMAEAEDPEREFLSEFKKYMEDPVAYRTTERDRLEKLQAEGAYSHDMSNDFMHLYREGVRPDDLEHLALFAGEKEGVLYDFEQSLKTMGPLQLKINLYAISWWAKRTDKALDKAFHRAGDKLNIGSDPRGVIAASKLQELESADSDVREYVDLHSKWETLQRMLADIHEALKEKPVTGESLAP